MPRGWRAIPLPPQLEHLPKDRRGFPIPYVAEWDSSSDGCATLIHNGNVLRLDCDCTIGQGSPILGKQCPLRQRDCMSQRRCQVCSYPIPAHEDCHFLGSYEGNVFWEPPLHRTCALYSLRVCPGITRQPGVGVTVSRTYALFDKLDLDFDDPRKTAFIPTGELPILIAIGLVKAGFAYHAAMPDNPVKHHAADFLAQHG